MIRCLLFLLLGAVVAGAQVGGQRALVATRLVGNPATLLLEVDVSGGGSFVSLGGFPSDIQAPLAVAIDPLDLDIILALDEGNGTSKLLRLTLSGLFISGEVVLSILPGLVTDLGFGGSDLILATLSGPQPGLWSVPRNGGSPALVLSVPRAAALDGFGIGLTFGSVLESGTTGPPPQDPVLHRLDMQTATSFTQTLTGSQPPEATSFLDLPTAIPRLLLAHPDGTISLQEFNLAPVMIPVTPQLPPGATNVIVADATIDPMVLGGQSHPFLKTFQIWTPGAWTMVAGPLPGDPVDVVIAPQDGARIVRFGLACSPGPSMSLGWSFNPQLGTPGFALSLIQGQPSSPAALVLGLSEDLALGLLPLPTPLPGGCTWHVDPLVVLPAFTDATGFASVPIPIPNAPGLTGTIVFIQWLQNIGGVFAVSEAAAVHLWP